MKNSPWREKSLRLQTPEITAQTSLSLSKYSKVKLRIQLDEETGSLDGKTADGEEDLGEHVIAIEELFRSDVCGKACGR